MAQRPRTRKANNVVHIPPVPDPYRLRWIEDSIKKLEATTAKHTDKLDKIDRNQLIMGFVIIALGVGSKVLSGPIADLLKNYLGI